MGDDSPRPAAAPKMPRRHHFLPQFYLAGFTSSGDRDGTLWILNREDGKRWQGKPESVAHQRDFYRVDDVPGVPPDAFEKGFAVFEGQAAEVLKKILAEKDLPASGTDDFDILINLIALMAARVPATRTALTKPLEEVAKMATEMMVATPDHFHAAVEKARAAGVRLPEKIDYDAMREFVRGEHYSIEVSQAWHVKQIFEMVDTLLPLLAARKWSLFVADDGSGDFITSDRPVALAWTSAPQQPGIFGPGFGLTETDVTFPLSKKLAVLGRFEGDAGRFGADRPRVATINSRTGMYCERFLCSSREDFPWLKSDSTVRGSTEMVEEIKKAPNPKG